MGTMQRRWWRFGAAALGGLLALHVVPRSARAECVANYCECPGGPSGNIPCGESCVDFCGASGGDSSGDDSGGESSGGSGGPGLIDALATLFAPKEKSAAELEAEAAAKAAHEQEIAKEQAEEAERQCIRLARIAKGHELYDAYASYRAALGTARGKPPSKEVWGKFALPLPELGRMPVAGLPQLHCAAFASQLAERMRPWEGLAAPKGDSVWQDVEGLAHRASTAFDTGTAVKGCEAYAPVASGEPLDLVELKSAVTEMAGAVRALGPATKRVEEAELVHVTARKRHESLEQTVARQLEAIKTVSGTFAELKKQAAEDKAEAAKLDLELKKLAWARQKVEMHERFDQLLAEQGQVHDHLQSTEKLMKQTQAELDEAIAAREKRRQELEADAKLYDAAERLWIEKQQEVAALVQKLRQNQDKLVRAGAAPTGIIRPSPRLVGK
jgi:hypothetical protein